MAPALTSCWRFSSRYSQCLSVNINSKRNYLPECVMFNKAPVAFLCTRISLDFASRVRGPRAPDRAILALLSSCVAKLVIQPTALHCTSTLGDIICRIRGVRPPRSTIATLFSAKVCVKASFVNRGGCYSLLTAKFPRAALAARCTSISGLCRRKSIGSSVSLSTSRTSEWRQYLIPATMIP